ncbi:hypothetical protein ABZ649_15695 [Streptomyces albidoflavus]
MPFNPRTGERQWPPDGAKRVVASESTGWPRPMRSSGGDWPGPR